MVFIKEEREDVKIEEAFRVEQEDAEEQTGRFNSQSLSSVILCLESLLFVSLFHFFCFMGLWWCKKNIRRKNYNSVPLHSLIKINDITTVSANLSFSFCFTRSQSTYSIFRFNK